MRPTPPEVIPAAVAPQRIPAAAPPEAGAIPPYRPEITWQTLYLQRRSLLIWSVSQVLLVVMYAALWPSIRDQPDLSALMNRMPEVLRSLLSNADMSTPVGYLQAELLGLTAPLLAILFAVSSGANGIAGEEDRRRLDLLLAEPVSRTRVVLEKVAAMVVGTLVLAFSVGIALVASSALGGPQLSTGHVVAAMVHLALLGMVFGALAAAIGGLTGSLGAARAVPGIIAVVAYVLNGLAPLVSWLRPVQDLSPFAQYAGHLPLRNGLSVPAVLVALGTVAVLTAITVAGFRRRDIGV